MKQKNGPRSQIKRWLDRARLTMDSGLIVLLALALATVIIFGFRHITKNQAVQAEPAPSLEKNQTKEEGISGSARIVDGDTLEVASIKIRLFGIDAPENGQICLDSSNVKYDCGAVSAEQLARLISGQVVSCIPRTKDRYGRTVAVCSAGGIDIGKEIVALGWAVAFERYSRDYVNSESKAHEQRLGLWQGEFQRPSEYRLEKRAPR
jgi:endonuclease YncB( thermonuclease family)